MRDIADGLTAWDSDGRRFAIATVVQTWHSAPRQPGAAMAVADDETVIGSVSGGCVEGAVYEVAQQVLETGQAQLQTYGISDGDAASVGLTCGGIVEIFVAPGDQERFPELPDVLAAIADARPIAVAWTIAADAGVGRYLVVTPTTATGSLGDDGLDAAVVEQTRGMLEHGSTGVIRLGTHGEQRMDQVAVFVEAFAPPPRMLVFGAGEQPAAVARMGAFLGYQVTVSGTSEQAHRVLDQTVVDHRSVICLLTGAEDPDVGLLERALRTPARYVGAMGGARETWLARLRELGLTEVELGRLSSPIGLDLGARTPQETAVAIAAEITAQTWGGSGSRLSGMGNLAIHR